MDISEEQMTRLVFKDIVENRCGSLGSASDHVGGQHRYRGRHMCAEDIDRAERRKLRGHVCR
jgi:hypothetical protein